MADKKQMKRKAEKLKAKADKNVGKATALESTLVVGKIQEDEGKVRVKGAGKKIKV